MRSRLSQVITSFFLMTVLLSALTVQVTRAMDVDFYSSNDILFYDPDACGVSNQNGDIAVTGDDNAEKIFRFLTGTSFSGFNNKPFNAIQAAGALGNFFQESGFNPAAIEGNGEGHGLAQWSYGRKTALFNLADAEGQKWSDLTLQFKMIRKEINASYGKGLINAGFVDVKTAKNASYIFQKVYESAGQPNQANRDSAAEAYYKKFKDLAPGNGITEEGTGGSCSGGDGSAFTDDGFVIYNQYDPQWANNPYGSSTIGASGCGPSSMAMIITALKGEKVTPAATSAYAGSKGMYIPGAGSSWDVAPVVAKHWGLNAKNITKSVSSINQALQGGALVITSGSGSAPFTSGGHYITIRGVTSSGKWKIGDSNGQKGIANSKKEWDPQTILANANADNVVAITK
jgi:hypothetical protein